MKVYLISGRARNGKGLASSIIKEKYESLGYKVCEIQVMRTLKGYLKDYFNWDGKEETKPREALQQIGTEIIREKMNKPYFHVNRLVEDIEILSNFFDIFLVTDIRLPLEIEVLKEKFQDVVSINITRVDYNSSLTPKEMYHITEKALDEYKDFDYEIINDSLEQFKLDVLKVVDSEVEKNEIYD
ncbi:MAG: hypothetical protein HFG48_00805 [Bacilli bacterium]|nr:hypothetical protein [Bacilli bacterium]